MQRRYRVHPDMQVETPEGPLGVVSQQALGQALVEAAVCLDRMGGVVTVVVSRYPTDLAGEMLTTGAIVEWKDRTDAKASPETATVLPTEIAMAASVEEPPPGAPAAIAVPLEAAAEEIGDGLDGLEREPGVDESSIPASVRA